MMTKITEDHQDFKTSERFVFKTTCEALCEIMRECLESMDQTLMGEVTLSRRYYRRSDG